LTCRDNVTFADAVAAAEQYEKGQSHHLQAIATSAPTPATNLAATATMKDDPVDQLTKKLEQLLQPMATAIGALGQQIATQNNNWYQPPGQQSQGNRAYNQQWKPRQPRSTLTCHRCGQVGHISRVCPNPFAVQPPSVAPANAPQQPTFLAKPQSTPLVAPAPQYGYIPTSPVRAEASVSTTASPTRPPAPVPQGVHFCTGNDQEDLNL
jgi:hypothetical protein